MSGAGKGLLAEILQKPWVLLLHLLHDVSSEQSFWLKCQVAREGLGSTSSHISLKYVSKEYNRHGPAGETWSERGFGMGIEARPRIF